MVEPIKPDEVRDRAAKELPDHVIETWNRLIASKWNGHSATIKQKEAAKALGGYGGDDLAWLNIEEIYRKAGWIVVYDQPAYCEAYYDPIFKFTKKAV